MAEIISKWVLETEQAQSNIQDLLRDVDKYKGSIGSAGDAGKKAFQESSRAAIDFNKNLANGTKIFQQVENSAEGFDAELKRLKLVYNDLIKNQKTFIAEGRYDELEQNISGVRKRMAQLSGELDLAEKKQSKFQGMLSRGMGMFAAFFAVESIWAAGTAIFSTTAEFEKYDAVLTNLYGSQGLAEESLSMIKDVAGTTPFAVSELTDAFVKLAGRGVEPTTESFKTLSDVAAATGKDMGQLTEAMLDVNNTERWNELGIKVTTNGNKISGTFRGMTVEADRTEAGALKMIETFGKMEGVAGSTDAVAARMGGAWNNFGDLVDEVSVTIGGALEGVAMGALEMAGDFLKGVVVVVNVLKSIPSFVSENRVAFYALGVALVTLNAANILAAGSFLLWIGRLKVTAIITDAVALKTRVLNAVMKANPIGLVITAISFLVAGMVVWYNKSEEVRKVTQGLFSVLKELAGIAVDVFKAIVMPTPANLKKAYDSMGNIGASVSSAYSKGYADQEKKEQSAKDKRDKEAADKKAKLEKDRATYQARQAAIAAAAAKRIADAEAKKKQDEADKKAAEAKKKALVDLAKQVADLEQEAGKLRLDMMDKNSKEYQDALYKQRLKEIQLTEDTLIDTSKKAGLGGKLEPKQEKNIGILRQAAAIDYFNALAKIEAETNEKVLNLRADSDEKEIALINLKYDKEIQAAKDAKNQVLATALEQARELELTRANQGQGERRLDIQEEVSIEGIVAVFNTIQGEDPADVERARQQAILDVQIEFAGKRLELLKGDNSAEGVLRKMQLANLITELKKNKEELAKGDKFDMLDLLGVKEEDREKVKAALSEVWDFISDFTAQQLELANQVVERRKEDVEEKENDLNTEIELNKLGFASNVETKRAELEESRKLRDQAVEDQRKAQRAQMAIDTINQTGALISSSADIIKGFSKIPIIGLPLGIAAVAAMFAAFVGMKAKSLSITKMEKGGLLGGKRHIEGGNKFVSVESGEVLEHETGEFFVNRKSTKKYFDWLEAMNGDDEARLHELAVKSLLQETGIQPTAKLPRKLQDRAAALETAKTAASETAVMNRHFARYEEELVRIRKNTEPAEGLVYEDAEKKVFKSGTVTRTIRKK